MNVERSDASGNVTTPPKVSRTHSFPVINKTPTTTTTAPQETQHSVQLLKRSTSPRWPQSTERFTPPATTGRQTPPVMATTRADDTTTKTSTTNSSGSTAAAATNGQQQQHSTSAREGGSVEAPQQRLQQVPRFADFDDIPVARRQHSFHSFPAVARSAGAPSTTTATAPPPRPARHASLANVYQGSRSFAAQGMVRRHSYDSLQETGQLPAKQSRLTAAPPSRPEQNQQQQQQQQQQQTQSQPQAFGAPVHRGSVYEQMDCGTVQDTAAAPTMPRYSAPTIFNFASEPPQFGRYDSDESALASANHPSSAPIPLHTYERREYSYYQQRHPHEGVHHPHHAQYHMMQEQSYASAHASVEAPANPFASPNAVPSPHARGAHLPASSPRPRLRKGAALQRGGSLDSLLQQRQLSPTLEQDFEALKLRYPPNESKADGSHLAKPPLSFPCLIGLALLDSDHQQLAVADIYKNICARFPYFKTAKKGWKNSIRHNLSLNKFFLKVVPPESTERKGSLWALKPGMVELMKRDIVQCEKKFLAKRDKQRKASMQALQEVPEASALHDPYSPTSAESVPTSPQVQRQRQLQRAHPLSHTRPHMFSLPGQEAHSPSSASSTEAAHPHDSGAHHHHQLHHHHHHQQHGGQFGRSSSMHNVLTATGGEQDRPRRKRTHQESEAAGNGKAHALRADQPQQPQQSAAEGSAVQPLEALEQHTPAKAVQGMEARKLSGTPCNLNTSFTHVAEDLPFLNTDQPAFDSLPTADGAALGDMPAPNFEFESDLPTIDDLMPLEWHSDSATDDVFKSIDLALENADAFSLSCMQ